MSSTLEVFFEILNAKRLNYYKAKIVHSDTIEINDYGLRSMLQFPENQLLLKSKSVIQDLEMQKNAYYLSDDMMCSYFLFTASKKEIYVVGPFLTDSLSIHDIKKTLRNKSVAEGYVEEALQYYNYLPRLEDNSLWEGMINVFLGHLYPDSFEIKKKHLSSETLEVVNYLKNTPLYPQTIEDIDYSYKMQYHLMEAISSGNADKARSLINRINTSHSIEKRTHNIIRDIRNMMIVLNTICRIAVQNVGISPTNIDKLSREFSLRIESTPTIKLLRNLSEEMIYRYCELVLLSPKTSNSKINEAISFIQINFTQTISLAELASSLNVTPNYLSKEFKKQIGVSFTEYLTTYRLNAAKRLLSTTNYSISEISGICGYLDTNYFSRIFKKYEGCTPKDFRNQSK